MPLKVGHYRNAIETPFQWRIAGMPIVPMAFRWRADNGPPLNAGLVALRF